MARNRKRSRGGNPGRGSGRTPGPLDSGETQLTEAQTAFGHPELGEVPSPEQLTEFEESANGSGNGGGTGTGDGLAVTGGREPARSSTPSLPARLIGFLEGSYRELKRVQWPDRRQVFQATGVVLGFVIVAGAFLGVASFAAQKIVNLILYGHG